MKLEETNLYTKVNSYLSGPDEMNNEVLMWAVAGGLFVKHLISKFNKKSFGGLGESKGSEVKEKFKRIRILDLCCGPGSFSNYLSLFYNNIEVVGIDKNKDFIVYANQKFSKNGWVFKVYNALKYKENQLFDIVLASSAYHHIPDNEKVFFLKNLKKNLKANGIAIVCENFLPSYSIKNRRKAIENYYNQLKKYYDQGKSTKKSLDLIDEVYKLEISGIEEYKVDFNRFESHLKQSGLKIEEDIPVWQPEKFIKNNSGSHVIILRKK